MEWTLGLIFLTILFLLAYGRRSSVVERLQPKKPKRLPPGPQGLPLIGNVLGFWSARREGNLHSYLLSLRSFGEMTTLRMGSQLWVMINTDRVAREIISKRSAITSERPRMPISSTLVSKEKRSVIQRTETWSEGRRLMRQLLANQTLQNFKKWQDIASMRMLLSFTNDPNRWYLHQARYATAVLYGVVTGEHLDKTDEQLAEYRQVTMEFLGSLFNTAVDFFPALELLPRLFQFWRPKWEDIGLSHERIFQDWWHPIKAKVDDGTAVASWVRDVVLNPKMKFKGGEEEALYLTNSVISAGGDNTRMTLNLLILASVHFPPEFTKCRQELDTICGGDAARLPTAEDASNMPYICAFIKEVMRWRPIVPLIPPHQLIEELEFEDFMFPKETNFLINTVAICADFDEHDIFNPSRWLDGNQARLSHGFWGFGGGRRICIGHMAAQPALFLALSRLIYCFDFGSNGGTDSTVIDQWSTTEPFSISVKSRSLAHERLIRAECFKRGVCA